MTSRNTVARSLHDLGAAAWFGGSLMGAVGLNGASAAVDNPKDRARVAATGWAKWAPVSFLAMAAHGLGGAVVLSANRDRVKHQSGVGANTGLKVAVTAAAVLTTAYSGVLGAKVAKGSGQPVSGATEPSGSTSPEVANAQRQLKALQWVNPLLTGAIVVLGAQQGEQQRPSQILGGLVGSLRD